MRWSTLGQTDVKLDQMVAEGKIGEFIVAIPSAANSFYTNTRDGVEKWEDMIVAEFIPMIESATRANGTRATRGISGTSMGGYGALKLAMKHPDLFGSASAHSAVLLQDLSAAKVSGGRLQMFQSIFDHIYGINQDLTYWEANNPMTLAKDTKKLNGLKIYFDCGTEDSYGFEVGAKQLDEMLTRPDILTKRIFIPALTAGTTRAITPASPCCSTGKLSAANRDGNEEERNHKRHKKHKRADSYSYVPLVPFVVSSLFL